MSEWDLAESASSKNPRPEPGRSDLCGHLFGGARRAVVLVRVGFGLRGGGAGGLGDAGNEALDQLDRTLQGAAGVAADVFVGREGDTTKLRTPRAGLRGAMVTEGAAVTLF